jgi:hypothetical protein
MEPTPSSLIIWRRLSHLASVLVIALLASSILISPERVSADIGPAPSMRLVFDFSAVGAPIQFDEVRLFTCGSDPTCADKEPMWEVPGQRLECDAQGCLVGRVMTGGPYWQVEAVSSDRVRVSPPFERIGFHSVYRLVVLEDSLDVEFESASERAVVESAAYPGPVQLAFLVGIALVATQAIELLVAALYLRATRVTYKMLAAVALVNLLTVPAVWLVAPFIMAEPWVVLVGALLAVTLVEGLLLKALGRGRLSWRRAAALSALMNAASAFLGLLLPIGW